MRVLPDALLEGLDYAASIQAIAMVWWRHFSWPALPAPLDSLDIAPLDCQEKKSKFLFDLFAGRNLPWEIFLLHSHRNAP
jgi:hypothetical protein